MENFVVSARKYRPATFDSVVGQAAIAHTLKSAITSSHLAHAYLFCGPRGVGKTTCARIFAKTINCENAQQTGEACSKCESCVSFKESRSYNIHELDAASNNSVDDIRLLIEQVRIPPQIGQYSVYIIDEVHMLSQQAFNAFLKTLEEPPKHAIFILATTEKHKIIPTILSRCQVYDFNRMGVSDTVGYLKKIADNESIAYEEEALHVIAEKADGGMRDALSIFDQIVSFSGQSISYQGVLDNLNILGYDYYLNMTDAFISGDISKALLIFDEILQKGFDAHSYINGLCKHFRDLLVIKDPQTVNLLQVSEGLKTKLQSQSNAIEQTFLMKALNMVNSFDLNYKQSKDKRLHVELALINLCQIVDEGKKKTSFAKASQVGDLKKVESEKEASSNQEPSHKETLTKEVKDQPKNQISPKEEDAKVETAKKEQESPIQEQPSFATPSSKAAEVKKATEGKRNYTPSTLSIKDALKGNTETTAKTEQPNEALKEDVEQIQSNDTFSLNQLKEKWLDFAETFANQPRIYHAIRNWEVALESEAQIKVYLDNIAQKEIFDTKIKLDCIQQLKKSLSNTNIEISTEVKQDSEEDQKNRLYTSEDKFRFLSEKNPNLLKLKQDFNLDFDY